MTCSRETSMPPLLNREKALLDTCFRFCTPYAFESSTSPPALSAPSPLLSPSVRAALLAFPVAPPARSRAARLPPRTAFSTRPLRRPFARLLPFAFLDWLRAFRLPAPLRLCDAADELAAAEPRLSRRLRLGRVSMSKAMGSMPAESRNPAACQRVVASGEGAGPNPPNGCGRNIARPS